jgi:hypothetical protein
VAGALYFLLVYAPAERAQTIEAWQARLSAMADDRRAAIGNWVTSGISDASTVAAFPTVVAAMAAHAGRPTVVSGVSAIQGHLKAVIDGFGRAHRRRALVIVDPQGAVVLEDLHGAATGEECTAVVRRLVGGGLPFTTSAADRMDRRSSCSARRSESTLRRATGIRGTRLRDRGG